MIRFSLLLLVTLAIAACDSTEGPDRSKASFEPLGFFPDGRESYAFGVSADGAVVVGHGGHSDGPPTAFRWDASGGMVDLETLSTERYYESSANGVSSDGRVVFGVTSALPKRQRAAFRWTEAGGMEDLGELPAATDVNYAQARASTPDGSVIVGQAHGDGAWEPFRWTGSSGMQGLGELPEPNFINFGTPGHAYDVSSDGRVIVGAGGVDTSPKAIIWEQGETTRWIEGFPEGYASQALAISADGTVIVGDAGPGNGRRPFRWTESEGAVWLSEDGFPDPLGSARDVSADGRVIVGGMRATGAFIWNAQEGIRSVSDLLIAGGVELTGWTLYSATGVSSDGKILVGTGRNPKQQSEAWRAVLP